MKKSVKWIIAALLLVGFIAGASVVYNKLTADYKDDMITQNTTKQSEQNHNSSTAPDFTVLDRNGNEVTLSDYKGKPVVLNFWATWCYYCKEEMPDFNEAYKNHPDVQFLMINATDGIQETQDKANTYVKEQGFEFEIFYDTKLEAVNNYNITGFPATYFIDKNGNIVTQRTGMIDKDTLEQGINMITQ